MSATPRRTCALERSHASPRPKQTRARAPASTRSAGVGRNLGRAERPRRRRTPSRGRWPAPRRPRSAGSRRRSLLSSRLKRVSVWIRHAVFTVPYVYGRSVMNNHEPEIHTRNIPGASSSLSAPSSAALEAGSRPRRSHFVRYVNIRQSIVSNALKRRGDSRDVHCTGEVQDEAERRGRCREPEGYRGRHERGGPIPGHLLDARAVRVRSCSSKPRTRKWRWRWPYDGPTGWRSRRSWPCQRMHRVRPGRPDNIGRRPDPYPPT